MNQPFDELLKECLSPDGDFHHEGHIKLAWLYLRRYPLLEAVSRFCSGLKAFTRKHGFADKYHQTVTIGYLLLTHERMSQTKADNFEAFIAQNPDLLKWKNSPVEALYTPQTLWSEEARVQFVLPDKVA